MDDPKSALVKPAPIIACRVCRSTRLMPVLDFGEMPLANAYLAAPTDAETRHPLAVLLCADCGCVQLAHTVPPADLFANYLYTSSTSGSLAKHFDAYAQSTVEQLSLKAGRDFVVGIGGNDGPLERAYQERGFRVLNVEASRGIAELSRANRVPTLTAFFGTATANSIVAKHGQAALVTCNNCFAHMPDIHDVVRGIRALLRPDGWFVSEEGYWLDAVTGNHFDRVYHEHVFYWTVCALNKLFGLHDLHIADVQFNRSQGGSIRVFVQHDEYGASDRGIRKSEAAHHAEHAAGLFDPATYVAWRERIAQWRLKCLAFLGPLDSFACYGVPAKFTMLSEQLGWSSATVHYAVDDSPIKVGRYTPGSHVPIVDRARFIADPPSHCVITAANYADHIIDANPQYPGEWLVLTPEPRELAK